MPGPTVPRDLILATFLALGVGFGAGYWLAAGSTEEPAGTPGARGAAPHPVGAQEYVQLGMTALSAGRFQEAEGRFRQALDLAPGSPEVRTDLAVALMYQERWDEAWEELQEAQGAAPEMPETYFLEGVVLRDARADTAAARASWTRFLELVPEDSPQAETVREWLAELDGGPPADEAPADG